MDSKRTSHILLTIIAVGIFFMIFLYMKENYFDTPRREPVVWEETVPARPSTTPTPTPSPTPTPTPISITQNINLVEGQKYAISFSKDETMGSTSSLRLKYCGEESRMGPNQKMEVQMVFTNDSCDGDILETIALSNKVFNVVLSYPGSLDKLNELNEKYDVEISEVIGDRPMYVLQNSHQELNAYTLSKIYFDTGYFDTTGPLEFSYGRND